MRFVALIGSPVILLALTIIALWQPSPVMAQDGCTRTDPEPGEQVITFRFAEDDAQYRLYVPDSYQPATPTPLVFSLHGFASSASDQQNISDFNRIADETGALVVYPQGDGFPARWSAGGTFSRGMEGRDDVALIRAIIAQLSTAYCLDMDRVYATGLSNGGAMAHRLACEASDAIAAIATVAGAYVELDEGCQPARPIPVIMFHGTGDPITPYEGGGTGDLLPAETRMQEWVDLNNCQSQETTQVTESVQRITNSDCDGDVTVQFYIVADGGHTWPDSPVDLPTVFTGETNREVNATDLIWAFLTDYTLPEPE